MAMAMGILSSSNDNGDRALTLSTSTYLQVDYRRRARGLALSFWVDAMTVATATEAEAALKETIRGKLLQLLALEENPAAAAQVKPVGGKNPPVGGEILPVGGENPPEVIPPDIILDVNQPEAALVDGDGQCPPRGVSVWFVVFFVSLAAMLYFNLFEHEAKIGNVPYALEASLLGSAITVAFSYAILQYLGDALNGWRTNENVRIICMCLKCISATQINYLASLYLEETLMDNRTVSRLFGLASIDSSVACVVAVILADNAWELFGLLTTTLNMVVVYLIGKHSWNYSKFWSVVHSGLMCLVIATVVLKQARNRVVGQAVANP